MPPMTRMRLPASEAEAMMGRRVRSWGLRRAACGRTAGRMGRVVVKDEAREDTDTRGMKLVVKAAVGMVCV